MWLIAFIGSVAVTALGFLGQRFFGLPFATQKLFDIISHFLGTPQMFQLVHSIFGFGEAGKIMAFFGSALLWLFGLIVVNRLEPRIASAVVFALTSLLIGPVAGLMYGLLNYLVMQLLQPLNINPERRGVLGALGFGAFGLLGFAGFGVFKNILPNNSKILGTTNTKLPEGITSQASLYNVSKNVEAFEPKLQEAGWSLKLSGLVKNPRSYSLKELKAFKPVTSERTMACISNPVGGDLIGNLLMTGLRFKDVLTEVGIQPKAKFVSWVAADGYIESLPLALALEDDVLLVYEFNAEPLTQRHGFPLRVIIPDRYGMKQPRWLTEISLTETEPVSYWVERGWSKTAFVQPLSRFDNSDSLLGVKAGSTVELSGIAFAGTKEITKIEVTDDDGKTWFEAKILPRRTKYAWTQWQADWHPKQGEPTLMVRCYAGGVMQSSTEKDSLPEAASGLHRVLAKVI